MDRGRGNMDKSKGCEEEVQELNVFHSNSRSVVNKIDALKGVACTEELGITGITETWQDTAGKKGSLKCFYANARSLRNKKDELFSYIVEENLDIVCITESWVNEEKFKENRKEYEVDGYTMYLNQRTCRVGGEG